MSDLLLSGAPALGLPSFCEDTRRKVRLSGVSFAGIEYTQSTTSELAPRERSRWTARAASWGTCSSFNGDPWNRHASGIVSPALVLRERLRLLPRLLVTTAGFCPVR